MDSTGKKLKLFGNSASRVTTAEMNDAYTEIVDILNRQNIKFPRISLAKALPSKKDHGDIDIVLEAIPNIDNSQYVLDVFCNLTVKYVKNYPILHCLYSSKILEKAIHVDFIFATKETYDSNLMYLLYNDFSGILGVVARKLHFNYGSTGFYKIFTSNKNTNYYIWLTSNLVDGLKILGYDAIIDSFDKIQNIDDIVLFLSFSDLFDSSYFTSSSLNRGDRKRMRSGRPSAVEIKEKLIAANKQRVQMDDNWYLKKLFPTIYQDYIKKSNAINEFVHIKPVYNGDWILTHFPEVKTGPLIGDIKKTWIDKFGVDVEHISESIMLEYTKKYIDSL